MKTWFPEKEEQWLFQVEIESARRSGEKNFVRYRPLYLQQQGAMRELEEKVFTAVFSPVTGEEARIMPGGHWSLPVEVVNMDRESMTVDYRHCKTGPSGEVRRMSVHVFRATFRRQLTDTIDDESFTKEWTRERREWQMSQKVPARGDWYLLGARIIEVRSVEGKRQIKYYPLGQQAGAAPRVLDESVFKSIFEPVDGAVQETKPGDEWFMMVEVTDYDQEELSVWYRPITSSGERKGGIRHLSDYIFMATFRNAR
jgi:hypothetical protein